MENKKPNIFQFRKFACWRENTKPKRRIYFGQMRTLYFNHKRRKCPLLGYNMVTIYMAG